MLPGFPDFELGHGALGEVGFERCQRHPPVFGLVQPVDTEATAERGPWSRESPLGGSAIVSATSESATSRWLATPVRSRWECRDALCAARSEPAMSAMSVEGIAGDSVVR